MANKLLILCFIIVLSIPAVGYPRPDNDINELDYAPGQLVIKLKEGKSISDIQVLNLKYKVTSTEKIFKDTPSPKETLKGMKEKLGKLDTSHESWYWQLDKNSQEYKDYAAKIEQEKEDLARQIEAQEKLIAKLEQRQKRAPADAQTPGLDNIYLLNSDAGTNIPAMEAEYSANDAVEYAEPNYVVKAMMTPNDPYYSSSGSWGQSYDDLWGLKKIQAEKAWDISQGEGVVVAVVDSGIDYTHEDIADNIWKNSVETAGNGIDDDGNGYVDDVKGYDFANSDSDPMDDYGHGTHVAGTIAATWNNSKGIIGVAYKAKVMALKGLDYEGSGYISNLASALKYAADRDADVINNSWGGEGSSLTIEKAVSYAYSKGCVIVAAAGNESANAANYIPASLDNVITVASSTYDDGASDFSNYGTKIDVAAPGGDNTDDTDSKNIYNNILSLRASDTDMNGEGICIVNANYYRARGTSMAAPHVSGLAALILSQHSDLSNKKVKAIIRSSADDIGESGFDLATGHGRLNAYKALQTNSACIANISSPQTNNMSKSGTIEIKGSAYGDNFKSYELYYSKDSIYNGWKNIGSTYYSQAEDSKLGSWDISVTGQYYLKLKVTDAEGAVFEDIAGPIFIDSRFYGNWPQYTGETQTYSPAYTAADLDNDGNKEIVVGGGDGKLYVFNKDGSYFNGWPVNIGSSIISDIASADIDGDGDLEIFFGCADQYIYGYHHNGSPVNGWPYHISEDDNAFYSITIADIDNNSNKEIIVIPTEKSSGQTIIARIINKNGNTNNWWFIASGYDVRIDNGSGPALADIDNDGFTEIVIPIINRQDYYYYLYIFDYKGNIIKKLKLEGIMASFTENSDGSYVFESKLNCSRPVIGDIDGDADKEIIISRSTFDSDELRLFSWSYDNGAYTNIIAKNTGKSSPGQIALADIDNNGDMEIILTGNIYDGGFSTKTSYLKAYNHDGGLLWEEQFTGISKYYLRSPIIADIDSDGNKEVMFLNTSEGYLSIYAFQYGASEWRQYNMPAGPGGFSSYAAVPIITDINNDGNTDMIIHLSGSGFTAVWDLAEKYNPDSADWPMFQHDIYRSGNYDFNPKTADTTAPEGSILLVSNSSGYTKTAQISLSLSASDNTGVTGYYLSENSSTPSADASGWITVTSTASYSADVSYTLSSYDGTKNIYCWYKDAAGNISEQCKTSAILDTTAPIIAITSPTSNSTYSTSSSNLNLGGTASDATSGVKEITWKSDKGRSGTASGTTSWSISNISLSKGKNIITVTAKDNAGNEKSTTLNITYTAAAAPSKPSNLSASAISTQTVKLIWKDNSNNETGFKIERKAKNSQYSEISVVLANITIYNDSGLKTHTEYTYRVRAYNNTGSSSYSNIATTTTKKQRTNRK